MLWNYKIRLNGYLTTENSNTKIRALGLSYKWSNNYKAYQSYIYIDIIASTYFSLNLDSSIKIDGIKSQLSEYTVDSLGDVPQH